MSRTVRLINGKGDWEATPPTGATDADLYQLANDFIVQGGVADLAGGDALVTETLTPVYKVKVAKGTIYVPNSSWIKNSNEPRYYQVVGDADEEINVATNSSGSTRVDLVCQKIDKITAPNDDATNVSPIVIVQGTPGSGAPAVPNDHELLATLTLPDGYAAVVNSMIADNRRQVYLETKDINSDFTALADGANITMNLGNKKRKFDIGPLTANRTLLVTNPKDGDVFYVRITNDGTPRSPVWFAGITWIGIESNPDMADYVDASKTGVFMFVCTDASAPSYDGYFLGAEE